MAYGTKLNHAFANKAIIEKNAIAKAVALWLSEGNGFAGMFKKQQDSSALGKISDFSGADYSSSSFEESFAEMFLGQDLMENAPCFDTSCGKDFSHMFSGCFSLRAIPEYDLNSATNLKGMLDGCGNALTIGLRNIGASLDVSSCVKLPREELVKLIGRLKESKEGNILRLGYPLLKKLDDEDIKQATKKGWIVC